MAAWEVIYRKTTPLTYFDAGSPHGYGVIAVKRALKRRANDYAIIVDPKFNSENLTFGAQAEALCRSFQDVLGLNKDGAIGPDTARELFRKDVLNAASDVDFPSEVLGQLLDLESDFDPGATNVNTDGTRDRGIAMLNDNANPDVDDKEAFDPMFAIPRAARGLRNNLDLLDDLPAAVASWNVGLGGAKTYLRARRYIDLVGAQPF